MERSKAAPDDFAVFEIVNANLKEIFVGVAPGAALRAVPARLPANAPLLHWDLSGPGAVRPIELDLSETDAQAFAANYVKMELPKGWRFLT